MLNLGNNEGEHAFGLCYLLLQNKLFEILNTSINNKRDNIQTSWCTNRCLATHVNHNFFCEAPPVEN